MKRHESLHSLSRDHHHALVQARDLILAGAGNDLGRQVGVAVRFAHFWESDLQAHFLREEQIVLPLLAVHSSDDDRELKKTLREHAEITGMVSALNDKLARHDTIEAYFLAALGEALRRHIRMEENEMFPKLEACVPEVELQRMRVQLEAERSLQCSRGPIPEGASD